MQGDKIYEDKRVLDLRYRMPISNIYKFFEGLEEGKLRGTKCRTCGETYFPPQADCPSCMAREMDWVDFSGNAVLETFTTVEVAPTSFSGEGRYVVAIGLLEEGVRVLSWVNAEDRDKIRVGAKMKLRAVKKQGGDYSYEFFVE